MEPKTRTRVRSETNGSRLSTVLGSEVFTMTVQRRENTAPGPRTIEQVQEAPPFRCLSKICAVTVFPDLGAGLAPLAFKQHHHNSADQKQPLILRWDGSWEALDLEDAFQEGWLFLHAHETPGSIRRYSVTGMEDVSA
jgi:hypothetical protein